MGFDAFGALTATDPVYVPVDKPDGFAVNETPVVKDPVLGTMVQVSDARPSTVSHGRPFAVLAEAFPDMKPPDGFEI